MGFLFVGVVPFTLLNRHSDKLGGYLAHQSNAAIGEIFCGSTPPLAMHSITLCIPEAVKWGLSLGNCGSEGRWPESVETLLG
jgi:hypothetical protein